MNPMDSRLPATERCKAMILALLEAPFTPHQLAELETKFRHAVNGRFIPKRGGRPRTLVCGRGHERTPANTGHQGVCLDCRRLLDARRRSSNLPCECSHPKHRNNECYHRGADGLYDCHCVKYRPCSSPSTEGEL